MDDILDDIVQAALRCERAARIFKSDPLRGQVKGLQQAVSDIQKSWSGSWIGYHARLYLKGFRPPRPGEGFDPEWGLHFSHFTGETSPGEWWEYDYEDVTTEVLHRAGVANNEDIETAKQEAREAFERSREELIPTLDALLAQKDDKVLKDAREELSKLPDSLSRQDILRAQTPSKFISRDSRAVTEVSQGVRPPPHLAYEAWLMEAQSYATQAGELARIARRVERYLRQALKMKGRSMAKTEGKIFIGHGRSGVWKDLHNFLQNRLHLEWDEFDRESAAGYTTQARLEAMLNDACFAFLVMTAEDEHTDSSVHARESVIHEVGLFQGRLGFHRAIILLEEGCAEFSNIVGLIQIRFPKGDISAGFERIRQVLEREKIIPK